MHLTKSAMEGVIILRGDNWETVDAFTTEQVRDKFCHIVSTKLEKERRYNISECKDKCRRQCSYVISLSPNKWY